MGVDHTGVVTGTGRFTLRANGQGGTCFAWDEELHFPWWLGGRLGELLGGRLGTRLASGVATSNLKRLVEQAEQTVDAERAAGRGH